ncbi:MAG: hypothetical protein AB7N70_36995 [Dehalococcoidia bacterium]
MQLRDVRGRALAAPNVLIAINVLHEGRYYYGNLIGLTDSNGRAELTRDELDLRFVADKVSYPMDYKIELEDADPLIEVTLLSEQEIAEARMAVDSSASVSPEISACYHRARNASFTPGMLRFWADLPGVNVAEVTLTTSAR